MRAFVTVGTTRFDDLIDHILRPESLKSFKKIGVKSILLQIGASDLSQVKNEDLNEMKEDSGSCISTGIEINYYRYKPNILQDMSEADIVIGHAGAGTVLECMRLRKRLMVVINEKLMDNHQAELAVALAERNHVVYCVPQSIAECLHDSALFNLVPYNPPDQKKMDLSSVFEVTAWDIVLLALLAVLAFRWWKRRGEQIEIPAPKIIPAMAMTDLTIAELKKYNGVDDERILFALNGTIYDVTRGRSFYGPGNAYGALAGHDATRALGKMQVTAVSDEWDDHADLTPEEKETADEWEQSFKFKYPKIGLLVKDEKEKHDYEGKMSSISL